MCTVLFWEEIIVLSWLIEWPFISFSASLSRQRKSFTHSNSKPSLPDLWRPNKNKLTFFQSALNWGPSIYDWKGSHLKKKKEKKKKKIVFRPTGDVSVCEGESKGLRRAGQLSGWITEQQLVLLSCHSHENSTPPPPTTLKSGDEGKSGGRFWRLFLFSNSGILSLPEIVRIRTWNERERERERES